MLCKNLQELQLPSSVKTIYIRNEVMEALIVPEGTTEIRLEHLTNVKELQQ